MRLPSWLAAFRRPARSKKSRPAKPARKRPRYRPLLEVLEDRLAPAIPTGDWLVVTLPGQTFSSSASGGGNTGTPLAQTAGAAFNVTLTATNSSYQIDTSFSGQDTIAWTGPGTINGHAPIYTTSVIFTSGQAANLSTTLFKAETPTLTANDGTGNGGPASSSFAVKPGSAGITVAAGSPQSATVQTAFAGTLQALVADSYGNPISGVSVNFAAPAETVASGTFSGGANTENGDVTNASGIAVSSTFTANSHAGVYTVSAASGGASGSANFNLTNNPGAPAILSVSAGSGQSAPINTAFVSPLEAKLTDSYHNPLGGYLVTFNAPASGASGAFSGSNTGTTTAGGIATSPTFTANGTGGTYTVSATYGALSPAPFSLTNTTRTASSTNLTTNANPSVIGLPVVFTAIVSGSGGPPTGNVTFKDGSATLGNVTLSGGVAAYTTSALAIGTHGITAVYGGNPTFTGSTSNLVSQVITSSVPNPVASGDGGPPDCG